jgi:hypothetical protein
VNKAFSLACGMEPQMVIGKTDFDIWPRNLAEKYWLMTERSCRPVRENTCNSLWSTGKATANGVTLLTDIGQQR